MLMFRQKQDLTSYTISGAMAKAEHLHRRIRMMIKVYIARVDPIGQLSPSELVGSFPIIGRNFT
jgi:hypothetical protein